MTIYCTAFTKILRFLKKLPGLKCIDGTLKLLYDACRILGAKDGCSGDNNIAA